MATKTFTKMQDFVEFFNDYSNSLDEFDYPDWTYIESIITASGWKMSKDNGFLVDGDHEGVMLNNCVAEYYQW